MCQFNIPFTGSPDSLVQRARKEIQAAGGSFSGDESQGGFQAKTPLGSIQGTYRVLDQQIALAITKKPFLISCSRIQKQLEQVMR